MLNTPEYSCRTLISKMNVEMLYTTEDPTDVLEHHQKLVQNDFGIKVITAFRPAKSILISSYGFNRYLDAISNISDISIDSYDELCDALKKRISFFHENGNLLCHHGLSHLSAEYFNEVEIKSILKKRRQGNIFTKIKAYKFQSAFSYFYPRPTMNSVGYNSFTWGRCATITGVCSKN